MRRQQVQALKDQQNFLGPIFSLSSSVKCQFVSRWNKKKTYVCASAPVQPEARMDGGWELFRMVLGLF